MVGLGWAVGGGKVPEVFFHHEERREKREERREKREERTSGCRWCESHYHAPIIDRMMYNWHLIRFLQSGGRVQIYWCDKINQLSRPTRSLRTSPLLAASLIAYRCFVALLLETSCTQGTHVPSTYHAWCQKLETTPQHSLEDPVLAADSGWCWPDYQWTQESIWSKAVSILVISGSLLKSSVLIHIVCEICW